MKSKKSVFKRVLKVIGIAVLVLVVAFAGLLGWLTATEYKPADKETVEIDGQGEETAEIGKDMRIVSWNIGYGCLGDNADFFMDGGSHVQTADEERTQENLDGIIDELQSLDPDAVFLQEVDLNSDRSHHINESETIQESLSNMCAAFAENYKVAFIPYPIPPIGKVDGGILTLSGMNIADSTRCQLPCPFKWPYRLGNLKRCVTISHVPVKNSDKQLAIVNLHLEAYDDGEGKAAQTAMLRDLLEEERSEGNYVIAGGDFNQIFDNIDGSKFPTLEDNWQAGKLDTGAFDDSWQFVMDNTEPSCRSLKEPYAGAEHDPEQFQYYIIDGFIVSDNIEINAVKTQNLEFKNSDHNPVVLDVTLK